MINLSILQVTIALHQYCQKKNRPDYPRTEMLRIRESINAGDVSSFNDEIIMLAGVRRSLTVAEAYIQRQSEKYSNEELSKNEDRLNEIHAWCRVTRGRQKALSEMLGFHDCYISRIIWAKQMVNDDLYESIKEKMLYIDENPSFIQVESTKPKTAFKDRNPNLGEQILGHLKNHPELTVKQIRDRFFPNAMVETLRCVLVRLENKNRVVGLQTHSGRKFKLVA